PYADMLFDPFRALLNGARLIMLPHPAQYFGIRAAVAENVIATRFDLLDDLGVVIANTTVQQDRRGQLQIVQDFEQAPISDSVAVVAPSEVSRRLLAGAVGGIHANAGAEREVFDIERHVERQPLSIGPRIVPPLDDRRIGVPRMSRKLQHSSSPCCARTLAIVDHPAKLA